VHLHIIEEFATLLRTMGRDDIATDEMSVNAVLTMLGNTS